MKEIKVYQDKDKNIEIVEESITFDKVIAGETTFKTIFLVNTTNFILNVDLDLRGEDIFLSESKKVIGPKGEEEVIFKIKPKVTRMQPIRAKLVIAINYIIK